MKLTSKGKERKQTPNDLTGGGRLSKMEELVSSDDERRWYEEGQQALAFDKKLSWQIYDIDGSIFSPVSHDLSRVADELRLKPTNRMRYGRELCIFESVVAPSSDAQLATYARLVADPDNRMPVLSISLNDLALASAPPRSVLSKFRKKCKEFEDRWNDHFVYPLSVQKHNLAHIKILQFSMRGTPYETSLIINTYKRIVSTFPALEQLSFRFCDDALPIEKVYAPPNLRVGKLYQKIFEVVAMAPKLDVLSILGLGHDKLYRDYRMDRRTCNVIKRSLPRTLGRFYYDYFNYNFTEPILQAIRELRVPHLFYEDMYDNDILLRMLNIEFADGMDACLRLYRISLYHAKLMDCGLVSSQQQRVQARDRYMDILKRLSDDKSIEEAGVDKSWRELEAECRQAEQELRGLKAFPEYGVDQWFLRLDVKKWTNAICRMTALLLSEIPEHLCFID